MPSRLQVAADAPSFRSRRTCDSVSGTLVVDSATRSLSAIRRSTRVGVVTSVTRAAVAADSKGGGSKGGGSKNGDSMGGGSMGGGGGGKGGGDGGKGGGGGGKSGGGKGKGKRKGRERGR